MNVAKDFVIPTLILTIICVVAAGALVMVQSFTQPVIDGRNQEIKFGAMREVLTGADTFSPFEGELPAGVTSINKADNGSGVAVGVAAKGYSSTLVEFMVGIKSDGTIEKIQVVKQEETPSIGTNALTDEYLAQFVGKSIDDYQSVDAVAGATITSRAVQTNVKSALDGASLAKGE